LNKSSLILSVEDASDYPDLRGHSFGRKCIWGGGAS
jgi:hypothetical protein